MHNMIIDYKYYLHVKQILKNQILFKEQRGDVYNKKENISFLSNEQEL